MFFAVTKLLQEQKEDDRPQWLFIENVRNLLSIHKGWDFAALLVELDEIGYDCQWQVLNSKDFGVPQNRERVFIIGHLRSRGRREIFPIGAATGENRINQIGKQGNTKRNNVNNFRVYDTHGLGPCLGTMQGGNREPHIIDSKANEHQNNINKLGNINPSGKGMNGNVYSADGISPTITTNKGEGLKILESSFCDMTFGSGIVTTENARFLQARYNKGVTNRGGESSGVAMLVGRVNGSQDGKIFDPDGISQCLSAGHNNAPKIVEPNEVDKINGIAIPVSSPDRINKNQNGRRFKTDGEPMFTLTVKDRHGVVVGEQQKALRIRKLTPKECFRLQGWEDEYFERARLVNSDSQLYKQAGNGVTVSVIQAIAERLDEE